MRVYSLGSVATFDIFIREYPNGPYVDPDGHITNTEPTVTILGADGNPVQSGILAQRVSQGYYMIQYQIPSTLPQGTWAAVWSFTISGIPSNPALTTEYISVVLPGQVVFDNSTMINELRALLKDTYPDPKKQRWTDLELKTYLDNSLWDINVTPPYQTMLLMDYTPFWYDSFPQWRSLILEGAKIIALTSQSIFEMGREFSYSDNGISLTMDRSGKYSGLMQMLIPPYNDKKTMVKKQAFMSNLAPQGLLTSQADILGKFAALAPMSTRYR